MEKLSCSPVSPTSLSLSHSKLNFFILVFNIVSCVKQRKIGGIFVISPVIIRLCSALDWWQKYWIFHTKTWLAAPTIRTAPDLPSDNSTTVATTSIVEHRNTWAPHPPILTWVSYRARKKTNTMRWHQRSSFLVKNTLVQRVWECLWVWVCVCERERERERECVGTKLRVNAMTGVEQKMLSYYKRAKSLTHTTNTAGS